MLILSFQIADFDTQCLYFFPKFWSVICDEPWETMPSGAEHKLEKTAEIDCKIVFPWKWVFVMSEKYSDFL